MKKNLTVLLLFMSISILFSGCPGMTGSSVTSVTGVTITATTSNPVLAVGETLQLTPVITPSNASNKNVFWSSSDTEYASIDSEGLVTAIAETGAAGVTITVTTEDRDFFDSILIVAEIIIVLNDVTEQIIPTEGEDTEVILSDDITLKMETPISLTVTTQGISGSSLDKLGDSKIGLISIEGEFEELATASISLTLESGFEPTDTLAFIDETNGEWVTFPSIISQDGKTITAKVSHFCDVGVIPLEVEVPDYRPIEMIFTVEDGGETFYSLWEIEYDVDGNVEKMICDDETYSLIYDDAGNLTEARQLQYDPDEPENAQYIIYDYEYTNGQISACTYYNSDETWALVTVEELTSYQYNTAGQLIKKEYREADDTLQGWEDFTYYSDGSLDKTESYSQEEDDGEFELGETTTFFWEARGELLKITDEEQGVLDAAGVMFSYKKEEGVANADFFMLYVFHFM